MTGIKLEVGKRYVRRDRESARIVLFSGRGEWPYLSEDGLSYRADGSWALQEGVDSLPDLVSEHVEPAPEAGVVGVPDLEEAIRLAEVGEYLYSAKAYSYGDGITEPREYGIDWQWQQSAPNTFGQGILLAEAVAWHEQMAADGIVTEASKLRAMLAASPPPPSDPVVQKLVEALRRLSAAADAAAWAHNTSGMDEAIAEARAALALVGEVG